MLLRSSPGRNELTNVFLYLLWPLTSRVAWLYRRLLVHRVPVVAVTGSFGKSTATRAIATAFGLPIHPRLCSNSMQRIPFALFRIERRDRVAVVETGIGQPGQMAGIAKTLRPDCAVVTSIGSDHNRSFKTLEVTRHEKAFLVRALPASGAAILNGDDPNVLWMAGETKARVITFGFGEANHVRATDVRLDWPHGTRFRVHACGEELEVSVRLFGRHMVYAALAAVASGIAQGVPLAELLGRLTALDPYPSRLSAHQLENGATLLDDDFKSTEEAIHAALDVLAEIPARRKIVVLGLMAEPRQKERQRYRAVASRVGSIAQQVILFESYDYYKTGLAQAGMPREAILDAGNRISTAIEHLRRTLVPGDVVLIKGRRIQRLGRIGLAFCGRQVTCSLRACDYQSTDCRDCSFLECGPPVR